MSWKLTLETITITSAMILTTTIVHGGGTYVAIRLLERYRAQPRHRAHGHGPPPYLEAVWFVAVISLVMFLASCLEISLWAAVYVGIGALGDASAAVYFSAVTFTAVGYGDLTLGEPWRLLSALEAINGLMLFGWTTSVVFAAVREVVDQRGIRS
jgi:hypothetical protein